MAVTKIVSGITLFVLALAVILAYLNPKLVNETKIKTKDALLKIVSQISDAYSLRFVKTKPLADRDKVAEKLTKPEDERKIEKDRLFTAAELSQYDGSAGSLGLYLAVMGKIYDVQKGSQHYKPGSSYGVFTGKDASRAFVTGDFTEAGLTDDIVDLSGDQLLGIKEWSEFYAKDYKYIGKLIGRFYNKNGSPTEYMGQVETALNSATELANKENDERVIFPSCNSEWSQENGGRVWCTNLSGGVERDWVGVPRQLFKPGQNNSKCVCVRNTGEASVKQNKEKTATLHRGDLDHPHLKEYPGCPEDSDSCYLK